jgi:hypothetical protein
MTTLDRRQVLRLLGYLGVTLVSGLAAAPVPASCASWLSDGLSLEALETLGREYLSSRSATAELAAIAPLINTASTDETALRKLQNLMRDDYANDRLVNLSGWFVSVTEGRVLAALANCPR